MDRVAQLLGRTRLDQHAIEARGMRERDVALARGAGDRDHRNGRGRCGRLQTAAQFEAVQPRHVQIGHDDLRMRATPPARAPRCRRRRWTRGTRPTRGRHAQISRESTVVFDQQHERLALREARSGVLETGHARSCFETAIQTLGRVKFSRASVRHPGMAAGLTLPPPTPEQLLPPARLIPGALYAFSLWAASCATRVGSCGSASSLSAGRARPGGSRGAAAHPGASR